jgi:hypothetical protein
MHGFEDRGWKARRGRFAESGRFGRMFPHLRSLKHWKPGAEILGKAGGRMDGGSNLDPAQDNDAIKAGYTFLGQFIDHDVTFDPVSVLQRQIDPEATRNFRTPVLELDSLYGQGPGQQPYLYDATRFRFLLEEIKDDAGTVVGHDLPRNSLGRALIGDPRNDENTIVSQLHLLFLKFHNKIYDALVDEFPLHSEERFEEAQRLVRWHYQWIVLHEFLPRIVGQKAIDDAMSRMDFRFKETTFMPVEFSVAAYRFGHSQVRPAYALHGPGEPPRIATIFPAQPGGDGAPPPPFVGDLRGGRPVAPTHVINWAAFFGPAPAQPSKLIDERLSSSLLNLPFSVVPPAPDEGQAIAERKPIVGSLATRNLQRGRDARLPSGQAIASCLGITTLSRAEVWDGVKGGYGDTPLAEVRRQPALDLRPVQPLRGRSPRPGRGRCGRRRNRPARGG